MPENRSGAIAAVRDDELVVLLIHLQELEGEGLTDDVLGGELAGQVRSWQEGPQALEEADRPASVHGDDLGLEDLVVGLALNDLLPGGLVLDALDRDQELAVLVLLGDDLEVHLSSQIYQVLNLIALVLDEGGLIEGEEGAGLGPNVDDGAPDVVLDDGTADHVVAVEGVRGGLDGISAKRQEQRPVNKVPPPNSLREQ